MKIVHYPHPSLRQKAEPVTQLSKDIQILAEKMLELMYEHNGVGLAAPQVAQPLRMIAINFVGDPEQKDQELIAINPVIIEASKTIIDDREGCLSFPKLFSRVRRPKRVKVQFYNLKGELMEGVFEDLAARIWQHEIDHLDGVLFIDKMGTVGRDASKRALKEFEEAYYEAQKNGEIPKELTPRF